MGEIIKSGALKANLSKTQSLEYVIPDDHQWFISLSQNYWGINNRVHEFFREFHHPYSNRKEVIDLLVNIAIIDFWVYNEAPERERAYNIIIGLFDKLLREKLKEELAKQLLFTYLDFFSKNYESLVEVDDLPESFLNVLDSQLDNNLFGYLSNIGYFKKSLRKAAENSKTADKAFSFMYRLIDKNITFWDETTSLDNWYEKNRGKMSNDYSALTESLGSSFFSNYHSQLKEADNWDSLCSTAFTFSEIIDAFRSKIDDFEKATEQFTYIFYLLHLPGVVYHIDYLLLDLNKVIKRISSELNESQSLQSIDELFDFFHDFRQDHVSFIQDSILTLGKEIINTQNPRLIHHFENQLISFGFISPGITYLTSNWELEVNPNHIKNIRVWLELIEYDPETMQKLLSALIINLRVGGIFIFDTDLFQKDITKLLNSRISPIYKQIKQLSRIFPVYFNEIGAEGHLRDVSTWVDELSHRNDKLIHFLRKQIHTEGNNSHIQLTRKIIGFWFDLDKEKLKPVIPVDVYDSIDLKGEWVTGVHHLLVSVTGQNNQTLDELLEKGEEELQQIFSEVSQAGETDVKRVSLIIGLYQLLKEKYLFETNDISSTLRRYQIIENEDIEKLETLLDSGNDIEALKLIYTLMVRLNEIIFDPAVSEGWESIYYKRHIAFGIPSMYGQYRETKFEAMGLTFRLERIADILICNIISGINTDYFTARTLKDIYSILELLREGLSLDGIYDQSFDSNLKMLQYSLTSGSFSIRQYINIFQFMEGNVKAIIKKYFIRPYDQLLKSIIPHHFPKGNSSSESHKRVVAMKSEVFYRELLSSAFLIQPFDNFLGNVLNNLRKLISDLSDTEIQSIMTYNPDLVISPIYTNTLTMDNQVFLGSKAYYLKKLYLNHFPVPPGFVITTEVFRRVNSILKVSSLNNEIDNLIRYHISELERITGLRYGDPSRPLLLSVRSGAAISMPGAMNTFLNVGLNDDITEKLSQRENFGWTSWDCYRRLLQTWGMSYGLERNDFDQIIVNYKKKYNVLQKVDFTPVVMKEIAMAYKQLLTDNNILFECDLFRQLKQAVISVFRSWDTPRAKVYREYLQIANEWGTAVIVQKMIFGNLHHESGSGVIFTRDSQDSGSNVNLTGDFSYLSQGEDIVAGLVNTLPISESQRQKYYQKSQFSLQTAYPKIFKKLEDISRELIEVHGFAHQEIEFTFESAEPEDLYILQTRDLASAKHTVTEVFALPESKMVRVGTGIGIGNRVLNGVLVFDMADLIKLKIEHPGKKGVLVRPDTVPDDIEMIFESEGLLTGRGGSTSHAAVTAVNLGKIGVVNCTDMVVYEKEKRCIINGNTFNAFDPIAIDGTKGVVYKGNYPVKTQEASTFI